MREGKTYIRMGVGRTCLTIFWEFTGLGVTGVWAGHGLSDQGCLHSTCIHLLGSSSSRRRQKSWVSKLHLVPSMSPCVTRKSLDARLEMLVTRQKEGWVEDGVWGTQGNSQFTDL